MKHKEPMPWWAQNRKTALDTLLIILGGNGWLWTFGLQPSPWLLAHYGLLIIAVVGLTRICGRKWPAYRGRIKILATVAAICLLYVDGKCDRYETRSDTNRWLSIKTYTRGGRLTHHYLSSRQHLDGPLGCVLQGPMAGEKLHEQKHGLWEFWDGKHYWKHTYYWYGQRISEGEWHLRNN